jgi:uncharacterized protein (TIGR00255 family)
MLRSMTGFGAASGEVGPFAVSVELRTVNHRFFTPSLKLPGALSRFEGDVREAMRKRVSRGHVTLSARIEREAIAGARIDESRFATAVTELRALRDRYALEGPIDVAAVLRFPDVMAAQSDDEVTAEHGGALLSLVDRAVDALMETRAREGAHLAGVLLDRLSVIETALARIAARAPERVTMQRDKLRAAVVELTGGISLDEGRLAQEIALLAEKWDVSEELDRFTAHIRAFRDTIQRGDAEPAGKRLGFLLQEMLREANTTGSKSNDVALLHDVVLVKEELERIREQVENLE